MFNLPETYAQQGKIANNIENHGETLVKAFDVPYSVEISAEQFNSFNEDPYADRWLFNNDKAVREPNLSKYKALEYVEQFEGATVVHKTSGGNLWTFHDCTISKIAFEAKRGGAIFMHFSVRLRPDGQQLLDLLDDQNREVSIDIAEAKIMKKGGRKQQELALEQANGEGDEHPDPDAQNDEPKPEAPPKRKRGRPRKNSNGGDARLN